MTKVKMPLMSLGATGKSRVIWDSKQLIPFADGMMRITENRDYRITEDGKLRVVEFEGYLCIYRTQPGPYGQIQIREKYYVTDNPRTENQQANRSKFADAVAAWELLSMEEQIYWNKLGYPRNMAGRNRYIRWYMLNN